MSEFYCKQICDCELPTVEVNRRKKIADELGMSAVELSQFLNEKCWEQCETCRKTVKDRQLSTRFMIDKLRK